MAVKKQKASSVSKGDKQRRKPKISYDLYSQMYFAFCDGLSAEYVARKCGVSPNTARHWIEEGRPDIGWDALRIRYKREMEETNRKVERDAATIRAENLNVLGKLKKDQVEAYKKKLEKKGAGEFSLKDLLQIMRTEFLCLGISDEQKKQDGVDPLDPSTWTNAMLDEFLKSGRVPKGKDGQKSTPPPNMAGVKKKTDAGPDDQGP